MRRLAVITLSGLLLIAPESARAQEADALTLAERAYGAVDFETQRDEAQRALEAGNADPARLARIYRLLGIAHAALGEPEPAKLAFMRLIALDPDVELEHVLSPRLRTPYMEARGYWDVTSTRLGFEVVSDASHGLRLTVHDPLGMAARVRVSSTGASPESLWGADAEPLLEVPAETLAAHAGERLEIVLLDRYSNVLAARSITTRPPVAAKPAVSAPPEPPATEPPSRVLPLVLAGGSLVALGIGASAHVVRERRADEWNGSGCEQPGFGTRAEQCADVDSARRSAERVAIAGYATGGALLAGSVVTYLLLGIGRHEHAPRAGLACAGGPTPLGLSCSTHF